MTKEELLAKIAALEEKTARLEELATAPAPADEPKQQEEQEPEVTPIDEIEEWLKED
ncbi:unknown [Streptococcus phage C1]|uniref:Uncharacterized protein n=1 Tax=Streptococcus phage C1 TaxID=2907838 RepID=Q7Y3E4_BPSC1|nr:hypothetical protein C1p18 [Streptococcus phage C1]AAP42317.1 unknown [Streptococcus phage C1]